MSMKREPQSQNITIPMTPGGRVSKLRQTAHMLQTY